MGGGPTATQAGDTGDATEDGRARRAARTRELVVEAFLDLVGQAEPQPTAQQVSDRSGVSMRSIFRLFEDVEALHRAGIASQIDRATHLYIALDSTGSLETRIEVLIDSRSRLFEAVSPIRRLAVRLAPTSSAIRADLGLANEFSRAQACELFERELSAMPAPRRNYAVEALDTVTSWETWERLRTIQELTPTRARRTVNELVRAVLTDGAAP